MKTTNVKPSQLNYHHYVTSKYDRDIVNAIPFHKDVHKYIAQYLLKHFQSSHEYQIIDLGTGTAITAKLMQEILPNSHFDLVDFSKTMLEGAKKKMGTKNVRYILKDFSKMKFDRTYDIVVAVIGVHHQTHIGKKRLFKMIYKILNSGGVFIFGDLVTYKDDRKKALNDARHFKHLADHTTDEKTLEEWAHHHMFLNNPATIEDQIKWLEQIGFKVKKEFHQFNTALLICKK